MNTENPAMLQDNKVVVYETPDGEMRVDVRLDRETVWLTQRQMSELFGRDRSVVTKHIRNIFKEGELEPEATCAKFAQVQSEGGRAVSRKVEHFNLDVIISVGYRINSKRGIQFRQWATQAEKGIGNYRGFLGSSARRQSPNPAHPEALQSGRHHLGRLCRQKTVQIFMDRFFVHARL